MWYPVRWDDVVAIKVRELGRFPIHAELTMRRHQNPSFLSAGTDRRFGDKQELIERDVDDCSTDPELSDVVDTCTPLVKSNVKSQDARSSAATASAPAMTELPEAWRVERFRRSVAMLPPGAPALNREKALELYGQLLEAIAQAQRRQPSGG